MFVLEIVSVSPLPRTYSTLPPCASVCPRGPLPNTVPLYPRTHAPRYRRPPTNGRPNPKRGLIMGLASPLKFPIRGAYSIFCGRSAT